jgi:hypothetical protein
MKIVGSVDYQESLNKSDPSEKKSLGRIFGAATPPGALVIGQCEYEHQNLMRITAIERP